MFGVLLKVALLFAYFLGGYSLRLAGHSLKRFKWAKLTSNQIGDWLLQAVFYVAAPALIYTSVVKVHLEPSFWLFCFVSPALMVIGVGLGFLLRPTALLRDVPPKT